MGSSRLLLLLFFFYSILTHFVKPTIAQRNPTVRHNCSTTGNVTSNSTYRANLNNLLSSLSSKTQMVNGFYNFSAGENSDKVNAIALCRADHTSTDCRRCVNMSAHELLQLCPNQKEGIIWYANCTVRYSDRFIFGSMESEPTRSLVSSWTDSVKQFNRELNPLLDSLRYKAAGFSGKFATGSNANNTNQNYTIYALLQCTPDLVDTLCQNCLTDAQIYITQCCNDMRGARVLTPSCNLRYENATVSMAILLKMNPHLAHHHHYLLLLRLCLRLQKVHDSQKHIF
jgi:hypothetical protein